MKAKYILLSEIVISALLAQLTFAALPRYEIIDLGTLGGGSSRAYAINDAGQVVGYSGTTDGGGHAFLWDKRIGMIDLGMLYEGDWSVAYGVNDCGQVVGFSGPDDGSAFIWDIENGMGYLDGVGYGNTANAINNAGQVVGEVYGDPGYAFLWEPNNGVTDLGTLGGPHSTAWGINNTGQVVGESWTTDSYYTRHAFLWDHCTGMTDLGTLGGDYSEGRAINDAGQVVGWSETTEGDWHAFLWDMHLGMMDLGPGIASAINDAGQVVGSLSSSGPAFYWDSDIGMIELDDLLPPGSGWVELIHAFDINNRGQIVGSGRLVGGRAHAFLMTPVVPTIYYVDADAPGPTYDGLSWTTAFKYLQDALAAAWSGDEIRVAQGIYTPDSNSLNPNGSEDRTATFQLINGVTIKGGYAGNGEPNPNTCDVDLYETILTGDLNGDDGPNFADNADNSYHVVTGTGTDETAVLDAFTITGGNANGSWQDGQNCGGGAHNYYGNPTLTNCTFNRNWADGSGGGMYNLYSSPKLTNCAFTGNSATEGGGGMYNDWSNPILANCIFTRNSAAYGGGIYNGIDSNEALTNCTFINNTASYNGAGMTNSQSSPTVTNCNFISNTAVYGGGMANYQGSSPKVTNCIFKGNLALDSPTIYGGWGGGILNFRCSPTITNSTFSGNLSNYGGGIYSWFDSTLTVTNCTFTGNSANFDGGGIYNWANSTLTVTNCILWGNYAHNHGPQVAMGPFYEQCTVNISYSNVQGGHAAVYDPCEVLVWEAGNIDADPCFVIPGYWDPNGTTEDANDDFWTEADYHLLPDSPCINAGDPDYVAGSNETDLDGRPRVVGGRIDMGAYEAPIFAEARILPRTINLASKGKWITAYIWLPEDYDVADIDPNTVFLEEQIKPEQFSVNQQKQVATAKFSREEVQPILEIGDINLTITGQLTDGTIFEGTDTIKVTNKAGGKSPK